MLTTELCHSPNRDSASRWSRSLPTTWDWWSATRPPMAVQLSAAIQPISGRVTKLQRCCWRRRRRRRRRRHSLANKQNNTKSPRQYTSGYILRFFILLHPDSFRPRPTASWVTVSIRRAKIEGYIIQLASCKSSRFVTSRSVYFKKWQFTVCLILITQLPTRVQAGPSGRPV